MSTQSRHCGLYSYREHLLMTSLCIAMLKLQGACLSMYSWADGMVDRWYVL